MIIYGWNSKNLKQAELSSYECPECQKKGSLLAIFSSYVHIFWIPLFPYRKSAQIYCTNCQLSREEKDLTEEMKSQVKLLKSAVKTPIYMFSGLGLVALFIAYTSYSGIKTGNLQQGYINDPQVGDVYVLKDLEDSTAYDHYLLKVTDALNDSLVVSFNTFVYNGIIEELDPEDGFMTVGYAIHKDQVKEFDRTGELRKVIRGYGERSGFDRVVDYPTEIESAN
ncbi:MAG: hypothetical protein AAGA85_27220 [Bacteroidota bacterium]